MLSKQVPDLIDYYYFALPLQNRGVILFQGHETTCGIFAKRKVTVAGTSLQA